MLNVVQKSNMILPIGFMPDTKWIAFGSTNSKYDVAAA